MTKEQPTHATPESRRRSSGGVRRSAVIRLIAALSIGLGTGLAISYFGPWALAVLVGWDIVALIFLAGTWIVILPLDANSTARHSQSEDPSRALANGTLLAAAVASLGGVGFILLNAAHAHGGTKAFYLAVGVLSVTFAWATVHTVFTLRYAAAFYLEPVGGIDFNEKEPPRYADFAYVASTIGMTFQVSDTNLTTGAIRRLALKHALLSYLFGAVILGLVINVVGSLFK